MSVNRYDPEDWGGLHMVPKPDGDWVCYEAWEHVNRQIAALKEENERLKAEKVQINGKLAGSRLAVSRLEARVAELAAPDVQGESVADGFREIVEVVSHIGVDFGYGNFDLSQEHIEKARALLEATPQPAEQQS